MCFFGGLHRRVFVRIWGFVCVPMNVYVSPCVLKRCWLSLVQELYHPLLSSLSAPLSYMLHWHMNVFVQVNQSVQTATLIVLSRCVKLYQWQGRKPAFSPYQASLCSKYFIPLTDQKNKLCQIIYLT